MKWNLVSSSNVAAIAAEGKDLFVRFHNGGEYVYYGAAHELETLLDASSVGSALNIHVKGKYDYSRV